MVAACDSSGHTAVDRVTDNVGVRTVRTNRLRRPRYRARNPSSASIRGEGPIAASARPSRPREPDLRQEYSAATALARNGHPITADDPPRFGASVLPYHGQQTAGFLVCKGKQGKLLAPVERGDDPRRPAAESTSTRIKQYRSADMRSCGLNCCEALRPVDRHHRPVPVASQRILRDAGAPNNVRTMRIR